MIVDLELNIDGLIVDEMKDIDKYLEKIEEITNSSYPIIVKNIYVEEE